MKIFLSLVVGCCLGASWVRGEVLECPGLTQEQRTQLEGLTVTEDIHDKLEGNFIELWGYKTMIDEEKDVCVKHSRVRLNDTHLSQTWNITITSKHKETIVNDSLEKVGNGVYILKDKEGKAKGKYYFLYVRQHVRAHFGCFLQVLNELLDEEVAKSTGIPAVTVNTENVKTPLEVDVQTEVDEAVKILKDNEALVGLIAPYANLC